MGKKLTTMNQLQSQMEVDFANVTLEIHKLKIDVDAAKEAEDALVLAKRVEDIVAHEAVCLYINHLREATGEQKFTMYVEDGDEGFKVFQDVKRQLVHRQGNEDSISSIESLWCTHTGHVS